MQRGKLTTLLVLMLFCLSQQSSAQEITNRSVENPRDSSYLVQFIALSDTARNFPELSFYGELVKEYLPDRGFSRFSIGYFASRFEAEATLQAEEAGRLAQKAKDEVEEANLALEETLKEVQKLDFLTTNLKGLFESYTVRLYGSIKSSRRKRAETLPI